jgi:polar amino acid transport system ATP-binding protein
MLNISHLDKSYNDLPILKDISCNLPIGTITALLGPSGSGKSTLLRCIARLESPDSGKISFKNRELTTLAAHEIGMVFQSYHLFPHLSVLDNLTYAPKKIGLMSRQEADKKAHDLLEKFDLISKANQFPHQLSGGQKQRIAIARALMVDPPVLLFDEPTAALDPEMVGDVAQLIASLKHPDRLIIIATHELKIAKLIADHVLFMDNGQLVENDPVKDFFENPKSPRAKIFLERMG